MLLPSRLRDALGGDSTEIDATRMTRILGWREDADLDFKQSLNRTREGLTSLASDIVAMANAQGGVIIVGVREEATVAVELTPLTRQGPREDVTEIYQAVAESVSPTVQMDIQQVPANDGESYFLVLTVPRSDLSPHALRRSGTHELRFPTRDGTRTRYLAEPELADRYRNRFRAARGLADRLDHVHGEGVVAIRKGDRQLGWLALSAVPVSAGRMAIESDTPGRLAEWFRALRRDVSPIGEDPGLNLAAGVGFRRVVIGHWADSVGGLAPDWLHCQFHSDGAGFFGHWCAFHVDPDDLRHYVPPKPSPIPVNVRRVVLVTTPEQLFDKLVIGLAVLAQHALDHAGTDGEAVFSASLIPVGSVEAMVAAGAHPEGLGPLASSHELRQAVTSQYTFPLRSLRRPSPEMMVAIRMIMSDLLSLFGYAGVRHIEGDGSVTPTKFLGSDLSSPKVTEWCSKWELTTRP